MPALDNPRYERLAWAIIEGLSSDNRFDSAQSTAYRKAYPACAEGNSAEAAASRLLRRVKPIMARVREIQQQQVAKLKPKIDLSKERVGRRLALASDIAEQQQNASAIATSELGIAKVFGHLVEKHEHRLSTDYSQAQSDEAIALQLLQQVGFASPDPQSIVLAIEANRAFVDRLITIKEQALSVPALEHGSELEP